MAQDRSDEFGGIDVAVLPASQPQNKFIPRYEPLKGDPTEAVEVSVLPNTHKRFEIAVPGYVISIGWTPAKRDRPEQPAPLHSDLLPAAFVRREL
jgi:hypothetical protein